MELIRVVETNSQTLDRIADGFSQILDRRTFTVFSFEEELEKRMNWIHVDGKPGLIFCHRSGR